MNHTVTNRRSHTEGRNFSLLLSLRVELYKVRHRFLWLLPIGTVLMEFIWISTNSYMRKPEVAAEGYYMLFLQLPLMNVIFLPLILAVLASHICDTENKGNTYKLLCTMQPRPQIYDAKLLLGALYVLFLTLLEAGNVFLLGRVISATQDFPLSHYLYFCGSTLVVSLFLFLMQMILSFVLSNQLLPLFAGLVGSLLGVFSAFLPLSSFVRFTPWGFYINGATVSSLYDRQTQTSTLYSIPFPWEMFGLLAVAAVVLYFAGKYLFLRKEV